MARGSLLAVLADADQQLAELDRAIIAASNTLSYLKRELSLGLPPLEKQEFRAERDRAKKDLVNLNLLKANIKAALVTVNPLGDDEVARLEELAEVIDEAIKDSFIINATLALAKSTLDAAEEIGVIVGG